MQGHTNYYVMKLSKKLLQTIAVAVTVGTATSGCEKIKEQIQEDKNTLEQVLDKCPGIPDTKTPGPEYNCPACGMG